MSSRFKPLDKEKKIIKIINKALDNLVKIIYNYIKIKIIERGFNIMKNIERFLELLNKEEVREEIKKQYCELHKNLWTDGYVKHDIILNKDGEVSSMSYLGNQSRFDVYEGDAIVIATIDDLPEVMDEDLGDIENQSDYKDFLEWILDNAEEDFEDEEEKEEYAINEGTWDLYYEFNESEYEDLQQQAWEFNCSMYDYDKITDIIYNTISELEELA